MKPVKGAFKQVSIVLAILCFILWNGYYSESSAHESLAESYIFDYEVEVLYTKINTAAVKESTQSSSTLMVITDIEKIYPSTLESCE